MMDVLFFAAVVGYFAATMLQAVGAVMGFMSMRDRNKLLDWEMDK